MFCACALAQTVNSSFNALVWADEFETTGGNLWRQATNGDEIFLVQNGEYLLFRKSPNSGGLVFPNEKMSFSAHRVEVKLKLDEDNAKQASGGMIVMVQEDSKGAFLVEINGKKEYQVSRYNGTTFKPLADWQKSKHINGRGEYDVLSVSMEDKKYDLYINGNFVTSFSEVSYKNGKIGLYAGPESKLSADYVHVYVTDSEKERMRRELEKQKEEKEDPTLTGIIRKLREQMVLLEIERDSLRVIVEDLKKRNGDGGGNATTQKLRAENKELKAEIEKLKKENAALVKENTTLKKFKETIQNNENGDIIINLTEAIETERQRIEILADENEKLYDEINKLKERLKN
jgi:hypothetical protein